MAEKKAGDEGFSPNEVPTEPAVATTGARLVTIEQKLDRALEALATKTSENVSLKRSDKMWRYVIVPLVVLAVHMLTRVWLANGGR